MNRAQRLRNDWRPWKERKQHYTRAKTQDPPNEGAEQAQIKINLIHDPRYKTPRKNLTESENSDRISPVTPGEHSHSEPSENSRMRHFLNHQRSARKT